MGADQVAVIRPLIAELEVDDGGAEYCAKFEVPGVETGWAEVVRDAVNVSYPYADEPVERLISKGVVMPNGATLQEWRPGVFATFELEPNVPSRTVAKFVDSLLGMVLGFGDDYELDASVVRLKQR